MDYNCNKKKNYSRESLSEMKSGLLLAFIMFLGFSSCKSHDRLTDDFHEDKNKGYRITRIRTTNVGYVIYARKGDLRYQIISSKTAVNNYRECEKIKTRNKYDLILEVVHPSPDMATRPIVMKFGRLNLPLRKKYHYKIYKANNLEGLCIRNEAQTMLHEQEFQTVNCASEKGRQKMKQQTNRQITN